MLLVSVQLLGISDDEPFQRLRPTAWSPKVYVATATIVRSLPNSVTACRQCLDALYRFSARSDTILGMNGRGPVVWAGFETFNTVNSAANPYPTRGKWMSDIMEQLFLCR
jgi:hypothetical protein